MPPNKRILIADDHGFIREALCQLVKSMDDWCVVGEASNGEDAIRLLQAQEPDLLLVDLSMPGLGGVKVVEAALSLKPDVRILVVTAHASSSFVYSALKAGAHGYLVKTGDGKEVLRALQTVLDGYGYLSREITTEVIKGYIRGGGRADESVLALLTPREREMVKCILDGVIQNKALANQLGISLKTVQKHKTNVFSKLELADTQELVALLRKKGID